MPYITDAALNAYLNYILSNATTLHVCSAEPASFAEVATYSLATKASPSITGPADRSGGGREITISAFTDGTVNTSGTATHYAIVSGSELLATNALSASKALATGSPFEWSALAIGVPDAVSA
jgi:hypothetical protein